MNKLKQATLVLAQASKGCPMITTGCVLMFYVFFNIFEAVVEKLIFGERFEHWLDPIFCMMFMAYSAYAVYMCAVFNSLKKAD